MKPLLFCFFIFTLALQPQVFAKDEHHQEQKEHKRESGPVSAEASLSI